MQRVQGKREVSFRFHRFAEFQGPLSRFETASKTIAARHPLRAVFRDAGFANDGVKINVEQIFKLLSPATEVKVI